MNFLLHFYLTHFLSDYPFQSGKLVKLKMERYLGVFLHTGVHLLTMLVILSPLLHDRRVWGSIALVYITHNFIDQAKVALNRAKPKYAKLYYFIDQFLHWGIIYAAARMAGDVTPALSGRWLELYTNQDIFLFLLVLVLATYFYDVTRYFATGTFKKKDFKRDYKTMLRNALIVALAFGIYWWAY